MYGTLFFMFVALLWYTHHEYYRPSHAQRTLTSHCGNFPKRAMMWYVVFFSFVACLSLSLTVVFPPQLTHLASLTEKDAILTGACFAVNHVALVAFDNMELRLHALTLWPPLTYSQHLFSPLKRKTNALHTFSKHSAISVRIITIYCAHTHTL